MIFVPFSLPWITPDASVIMLVSGILLLAVTVHHTLSELDLI
jgi:hypothetical protein